MTKHIDVFISSTSEDLREHRQAVSNALIGIGLFPNAMEFWAAEDKKSLDLCRQKIEEAEIYIGIYAHRYGWRPGGKGTKSITEMEYDWATERKIPRICFIMDDKHPWPIAHMELDAKADLDAFKARVKQQVVGFFTTPDDLKAKVLQALAKYAQKQDISITEPYLRRLHHDAMQSGLLRTLDPRSKDPVFRDRQVTVDQVYTPLDTQMPVFREKDGSIRWLTQLQKFRLKEGLEDLETSPLAAMEAASHFPRLVVLGDPGSGKSTFVNFLALGLTGHLLGPDGDWLARLRDQGWEHDALLPVHITLRDFAQQIAPHSHGAAQHILDHIAELLKDCGCAEALAAVKGAMLEGKALLILDGLDEVPAEKRDTVREAVQMFMQAYDACRVLITCRILSYANPQWQIPNTETVTLAPFDDDKIKHFIKAWYTASQSLGTTDPETAQARIADLITAVDDSRLHDMAGNPMLLTVMAIVHNHRGTLPRETARLYHECVEILMLKWKPDAARHLKEVLDLPDENDLYRILWQIAYEAHEKQADREGAADISKREVIGIAAEYHLDGSFAKAELFCEYVEERAGLLIGRGGADSRQRIYAFPHRTFQEYLAGCHIADDVDFAERVDEKARAGANWRQVVLLATGHMYFNRSDRNQPLLAVQYILRDDPQSEADWQAVALAGEMLLLIGQPALEKHKLGSQLLPLARQRLAALVADGHLEPVERAAAGRSLGLLGDPRPGVGVTISPRPEGEGPGVRAIPDIDWVKVPAGEFIMGSDKKLDPDAYDQEFPQHRVYLPDYAISRYPITYAQYEAFVNDSGYTVNHFWTDAGLEWRGDKRYPEYLWNDPAWHIGNHPVVGITWYEAYTFTRWLSAHLGVEVRLPTEAEWEKAARGPSGLIYPYGNEFDVEKANTVHLEINRTSAAGIFPAGASPYGVLDMSGNVWDWCLTKWRDDYTGPEDNDPAGNARRVVRGGAWYYNQDSARAAYRFNLDPNVRYDSQGFRVLCASPI